MTVGELEQKLKRDFTSKIKRKYSLDGMKSMIDNYPVLDQWAVRGCMEAR
jgi:hypothetical protein